MQTPSDGSRMRLMMERPAEFNRRLIRFLDRVK
jgi:hypothetical protein